MRSSLCNEVYLSVRKYIQDYMLKISEKKTK
uniref:Uncharacterized protein n=1 Tax=Arundo donax TaxID=35708 RepID=A0A0A9B4Z0_ARUDO